MSEEIKDLLSGEIESEIQALSSLESGSKEKSAAIDDLVKLYKLRIEETKVYWDAAEKSDRRIMEGEHYRLDADMK